MNTEDTEDIERGMRRAGRNPSSTRSIAFILVVLAIAAGFWHWRSQVRQATRHPADVAADPSIAAAGASGRPGAGGSGSSQAATGPSTGVTSAPGRVPQPPAAALQPPPDTPLRDVLALLRDAADRGDPHAACRVGIEMARCLDLIQLAKRNATYDDVAVRFGADSLQALQARASDEAAADDLARGRARCQGVPETELANAWRYLWEAAAAGNIAAASRFARDPGLRFKEPATDAEGWAIYRDHAPEMLALAVNGGDVMAAYQGAFSLASGLSYGGKDVFHRDPYAAYVYGFAVLPYLDARRQGTVENVIAQAASTLGPDRVLQAQRDATALSAKFATAGATPLTGGNDNGASNPIDCGK